MTSRGYFRYPTVFGENVVFVSEDDLWEVPLAGGRARRLTAGLGAFSRPQYSPDGRWLAFSSAEEGHLEVFVMPAEGGEIRRLTYLAAQSAVTGWRDSETILFASTAFEPHRAPTICQISIHGGLPTSLRLGPAVHLALGVEGVVLERNAFRADPAHWKRYRGGTAGKLWYARDLDSEFKPLISLAGNLSRPLWVKGRVYFLSDHQGVSNLYSCTPQGEDLRQETRHDDYYARNPATDGRRVVYHLGASLYMYDVEKGHSRRIDVQYHSQRTQRQRRFVKPADHLESAGLNHDGEEVVITTRGQVHHMSAWESPVGVRREAGARYRLARFTPDGHHIVSVIDSANGDEILEVFNTQAQSFEQISNPDWGRFVEIEVSPRTPRIAFTNHRNEIWIVDYAAKESRRVSRSEHRVIRGLSWSPDGTWLAFSRSESWNRSHICIADAATGEFQPVTEPLFEDFSPSFDPDGRYLYFLSTRKLNPVYDAVQFELSFPKAVIPCLVTLRTEFPSPFLKTDPPPQPGSKNRPGDGLGGGAPEVKIDFDGIHKRVLAFPLPEARYEKLFAGDGKKVFLMCAPIEGALDQPMWQTYPPSKNLLKVYDFRTQKASTFATGISEASVSFDGKSVLLRVGKKLKVQRADARPRRSPPGAKSGRESGWIDLERAKVLVEPAAEWKQMLHEVWRLQRDHFWRADMSKVNWAQTLDRYRPLLDHVNTRTEFADLVWEMQGELGTSHAYDIGGDYRREPSYPVGLLGAEFSYDKASGGYRIERLIQGDAWNSAEACPVTAPGVGLAPGDILLGINGQKLSAEVTPNHLLLHLANSEVDLTAQLRNGELRRVRVRALAQETPARYREWVESRRRYVSEKTRGRVGYIHIPDMGARGFAEFHRHFLRDYDKDALIVDVRYNGGGHVSQLLLEKLCRKRMGADETRWFGTIPFPEESPAGPMVALTNEYAGSDGDIFSHAFKLKKAGPLIGRRTWGGVVGIWPRHFLVDGGITTQPEFSHWFVDVGWQVENYGVEPDIDIDNPPHAFRCGEDPQLDRGIREVLKLLEKSPPFRPVMSEGPDLGFSPSPSP
ncbi:MAG: S41 family peptidase [Bdellovibrionales bacterium]